MIVLVVEEGIEPLGWRLRLVSSTKLPTSFHPEIETIDILNVISLYLAVCIHLYIINIQFVGRYFRSNIGNSQVSSNKALVIFLYVVFGTQKRPWYHWDDALQMKYCLKQWSYDIRFLIIDIQKSIWLDLLHLFSCWYFSSYTIITSGQTLLFKKAPHYKFYRYYLCWTTSDICSSNSTKGLANFHS